MRFAAGVVCMVPLCRVCFIPATTIIHHADGTAFSCDSERCAAEAAAELQPPISFEPFKYDMVAMRPSDIA